MAYPSKVSFINISTKCHPGNSHRMTDAVHRDKKKAQITASITPITLYACALRGQAFEVHVRAAGTPSTLC